MNAQPPVSGRLLSVEHKTHVVGETSVEVEVISVVTDAGEVREIELTPAVSVRLAEPELNREVGRYLTLLASERDQDLRRMAISTAGKGERQIYVSYISEVPVWKTTYRIVLPTKAESKPLLQGWAIVDNTIGEDWDDAAAFAGGWSAAILHHAAFRSLIMRRGRGWECRRARSLRRRRMRQRCGRDFRDKRRGG